HTRSNRDWSSDVCSSDLNILCDGCCGPQSCLGGHTKTVAVYPAAVCRAGRRHLSQCPEIFGCSLALEVDAQGTDADTVDTDTSRSEERRVGKGGHSWCSS